MSCAVVALLCVLVAGQFWVISGLALRVRKLEGDVAYERSWTRASVDLLHAKHRS